MEIWKPVPISGLENLYTVSSKGRISRVKSGKILKPHVNKKGYLSIALCKKCRYTKAYIHRLVLMAFTTSHLKQVNHKNGIKADNTLENLEWVSARENLLHACRTLGVRTGSNHWNAKLDDASVAEMRSAHSSGESVMSITRRFTVSHATVSRILSGKIWRQINLPR